MKSLRTLRALRPLRALSRFESIRVRVSFSVYEVFSFNAKYLITFLYREIILSLLF